MKKAILIMLGVVFGLSTFALAGTNYGVAKGTIHVRTHNEKAGCTVTINSCSDIAMTAAGSSIDAFPVFYDLVEYTGCEYGVTWPDWTYSAAFTNCAPFVVGSINYPGQGASHTWSTCQTNGVCVPAYLWLFADGPGQICLTGHPQHGSAYVLDCATPPEFPELDVLIGWGCAGVYGGVPDPASGDACDVLPEPATEPTTWGEIKSLFQ